METPAIAKPFPPYSYGLRFALTKAMIPSTKAIGAINKPISRNAVIKPRIPNTIEAIARPDLRLALGGYPWIEYGD